MTLPTCPFTFNAAILHSAHASTVQNNPAAAALATAAALFTARHNEWCPTGDAMPDFWTSSVTAKPKAIATPGAVLAYFETLMGTIGDEAPDDWLNRLLKFQELAPDMSLGQQVDALRLILTGAVYCDSPTRWFVQSSREYTVTLHDPSGDHNAGFTCTCKAYWSHGGGGFCKHTAAVCIEAFAMVSLV